LCLAEGFDPGEKKKRVNSKSRGCPDEEQNKWTGKNPQMWKTKEEIVITRRKKDHRSRKHERK
jgi:hypothetical protein